MFKKIKNLLIKKPKFKLMALSFLPMLSGCNMAQYKYYGSNFIAHPIKITESAVTDFRLSIINAFNGMIAGYINVIVELTEYSYDEVINQLSSFDSFGSIITICTIVGAIAVIVRYGLYVLKNFSTNIDVQYNDAFEALKKVVVALVMVFLTPYVAISGFMLASGAGVLVTKGFANDTDVQYFQIYGMLQDNNITPSTYCEVGQKAAGVRDLSDLNTDPTNGEKVELITLESASNLNFGTWATTKEEKYNLICGAGGSRDQTQILNVWQSMQYHPNFKNLMWIGSKNSSNNMGNLSGGFGSLQIINAIVLALGLMAIFLGSTIMIIKRVFDLMITIAMSWWFISASITDHNGESMRALINKFLSICLSQFIFCIELGLFATLGLATVDMNPAEIIAWAMLILGTPTFAKEMVNATGAGDDLKGYGKIAGSLFGGMLGK